MPKCRRTIGCALALSCTLAVAQDAGVLRDLDAKGRSTLSKEELTLLLTDAKMSRVSAAGNSHYWKNEAGGTFIISSDNRDKGGKVSTANGKWHISDDGRYCVLIEWRGNPTEEWCRYIVKAGTDFYATKSDKMGTEKIYKLSIAK